MLGVRLVTSAVQFWLFSCQFLASNGLLCASLLPLFLPNNKTSEGWRKDQKTRDAFSLSSGLIFSSLCYICVNFQYFITNCLHSSISNITAMLHINLLRITGQSLTYIYLGTGVLGWGWEGNCWAISGLIYQSDTSGLQSAALSTLENKLRYTINCCFLAVLLLQFNTVLACSDCSCEQTLLRQL